jgi:hypothetical protein
MFTVTKRSDWSFDTSGGVSMSAGPGTALERLRRERKRKADILYPVDHIHVLPVLKDLRRRAGRQHEV